VLLTLADLRARLEWAEDGGPTVAEPNVSGFGSRLLRQNLSGHTRSPATMKFAPSGVRWGAEFELAATE
jgi:hypothetical protein